ncbi:barstar family protein [Micromonospora auratinigra]|uniref:Barstar (Barnase inhibitor) n=1 Tax=Micromonospora auratinigra TaxID=261654 RepID=A0A1A8Z5W2_9ACTN|nr:barstar family protein [Micromonospora auratinigra]SBT39252.1 Barstar (barnase inhibitor) [Micromonospora auratinigra]
MPNPPRWRLLDMNTDVTLTECADVDGLFVDHVFPVEPDYERYTLVGCAPSGPLRAAVDGTGPAWLGNVLLEGAHVPDVPVSHRCGDGCAECWDIMEELLDVRVVGHRTTGDGSGRLDIDLDGHRRDSDSNGGGTRPPTVAGHRLFTCSGTEETAAGECRDVTNLFHARPEVWPEGPPLTLRGCRTALTGPVEAELAHVRVDGTVNSMGWGHRVVGNVLDVAPSALGDDLVDITLDARIPEPLAANDRPLWDMWRAGGPTEPNGWAPLERSDRHLWVRAAAIHRIHAPDKPAGTVYHLDGRFVTDYDAFYCAIGEAINGPGGWFGGDLFWLHENAATGDGGATPGFRLVWHHSEVARAHLVPGYDRKSWDRAVTFDDLVQFLTQEGVRLELR